MSRLLGPLGERLREERIRLDLNQDELAEKIGVSKNSVGAYERGKTEMKVPLLLVMQDVGIDIGYILTGKRTDGSLDFASAELFRMLGNLSVREREAVFALVSSLAGETIALKQLDLAELPKTLHSPQRDFRGKGE